MIELMPCAYCGGKPRVFRLGTKPSFTEWGCECVQCGAMPFVFVISNVYENDMEYIREVIARKWNRRPIMKKEGAE